MDQQIVPETILTTWLPIAVRPARHRGGSHPEPSTTSPARIAVQVADSITTIRLTGEPDRICRASFLAELRNLAQVCAGDLVADLLACTDVPAGFLAEVLAVHTICARHRCTLVVRVPGQARR